MTVGPGGAAGTSYEDRHAPQRHGRFLRTLFSLSGQEHRISPRSAAPVAILMILAFLISGLWQVAAVYVAARYELGVDSVVPVLAAGGLIAVLVMAFDWDLVHHRLRGETRVTMLVVRIVFVTIMALLVSEAVAGWVFDKDIVQQVQRGNDVQKDLVRQRADQDKAALAKLDATLVPFNRAVSVAQTKVDDAQAEMDRQKDGFDKALEGRGPKWREAKFHRDTAQKELDRVEDERQVQAGLVASQQKEIRDAQAKYVEAHPTVDPGDLGPAERERALWTYLLHNPDALFLRRIPLMVVLVFFDLLAVVLGWGVSRRIRERHVNWFAEVDQNEERARRRRKALADAQAEADMQARLEGIADSSDRHAQPAREGVSGGAGDLRGAHAAIPTMDHPSIRRPSWNPGSAYVDGGHRSTDLPGTVEEPPTVPSRGFGPARESTLRMDLDQGVAPTIDLRFMDDRDRPPAPGQPHPAARNGSEVRSEDIGAGEES